MKINYSPVAIRDMQAILDYYANVTHSAETGVKIVRSIQKSCTNLKNFPQLGKLIGGFDGLFCNYRFLIVDRYCVVYKLGANDIYIETIIDARRDFMVVLQDVFADNKY